MVRRQGEDANVVETSVKLSRNTRKRINEIRGKKTVSEWIRDVVESALAITRKERNEQENGNAEDQFQERQPLREPPPHRK